MRCNNSFSYHQLPFGEYKSWSPEKWCVIELGIYRCAINGDVQHLGGLCRCIYDLEVISSNNLVVSVSLRRVLQNHNPAGKYKYVQNKYGKKNRTLSLVCNISVGTFWDQILSTKNILWVAVNFHDKITVR